MAGVTYGDALFILLVCAVIWSLTSLMNRSRRVHPANQPAIPDQGAGDGLLREVLTENRLVALVGDFSAPDSYAERLLRFLETAGYRVHRVSGEGRRGGALPAFRALDEILPPPELVIVALPSAEAVSWAKEAVSVGARALWLEKGTISPEAMETAREGELAVVMDHAIEEEHRRLLPHPR